MNLLALTLCHVINLVAVSGQATPAKSPTPMPSFIPNSMDHPPPCISDISQLAYINGMISSTQTFYNCLANIPDPVMIPTLYNGTIQGTMIVNTSLQLNNLHEIDAVAGTATLDFYLRLVWQDNRLSMPLFWEQMSPYVQKNGIALNGILELNDSAGIWYPDIRFHDVVEVDYVVEAIRLNASNVIFWSRHVVITLMQPLLKFVSFPSDTQIVNIRYGSFAYAQQYLRMNYWGNALSFNTNFDGTYTFMSNPIWSYNSEETSYTTYVSSSGFLNSIYHIAVTRKGNGIIIRLVLPITLLLFLSALTFWVDDVPSRIDSTITLLLSVSALYIVILGNIPMLGYLTNIDKYVFSMFLLLVIVVGTHQAHATLKDKIQQWPLREVYVRLFDMMGRVGIVPVVVVIYNVQIKDAFSQAIRDLVTGIALAISTIVFYREFFGVRKVVDHALALLVEKVNKPETKVAQLSVIEVTVFNMWMLKKVSCSAIHISEYLHHQGRFEKPDDKALKVQELYAHEQEKERQRSMSQGGSLSSSTRDLLKSFSKPNLTRSKSEGSAQATISPLRTSQMLNGSFEMTSIEIKRSNASNNDSPDSDDDDV